MRINATALTAAAFAAVLFSAGAARAEQSPLGVWIDHTGRGAVEIKDCNGKLCGYVAWVKDPKDADGCGAQIIGNVKSIGGGTWDNGWIYDPDRDEKFDVEITPVSSDKLRVVGYAGIKWLSETMTWKRAPATLKTCDKSDTAAEAKPAKDKPTTAAVTPVDKKSTAAEVKPVETKPAETKSTAKVEDKLADDADEETTAAAADEADEPETKSAKKGGQDKAAKEIADALNLRKVGPDKCRVDVPYVDMVLTFRCDGKD